MAEKTSGLYSLITVPALYAAFQNALGGRRARVTLRNSYFPDLSGQRVLEVGCGPGTWYSQLTDCASYVGVDWNPAHVETAKELHGDTDAVFISGDVTAELGLPEGGFDVVFAFGLLHHLDDAQANRLLAAIGRFLVPDGRFLATEPVYHAGQNPFAKWMNDRDSGQNIRTETEYLDLLAPHFSSTKAEIRTDLLRIPYSHCVLQASGPTSAS